MAPTYVLFGANSAIANAYLNTIVEHEPNANIICVSRQPINLSDNRIKVKSFICDYSTASLNNLTHYLKGHNVKPHQVVIFNGQLHNEEFMPEKKLEDIDANYFNSILNTNTLTPILCLQAIIPLLDHHTPCTITSLSARVGSISDNKLGGWYSYRASKSALNMLFQTAAIELARRAKQTRLVLFHPGTTDTALSKPFQKNVPQGKLFTAQYVARSLYTLLNYPQRLGDAGNCAYIDYQGNTIAW